MCYILTTFQHVLAVNDDYHYHMLHSVLQSATNIAICTRCTSVKKKENNKLAKWALKEINNRCVS